MTYEEVISDFRKKYEHTYIIGKLLNREEVFFVEDIKNDGRIVLISKEEEKFVFKYGSSNIIIKTKLPEVGYFCYDDRLFLITKTGARQWKRGLCDDSFLLEDVSSPFNSRKVSLNLELAEKSYESLKNFSYKNFIIFNKRILKTENNFYYLGTILKNSNKVLERGLK